jgi:outer membrane immunogenic protein
MRIFKLAALAASSLAALTTFGSISGSATAADLALRPAAISVWSWTGCYIGGHVGYQRSSYDQHLSFDDVPPSTQTEFTFTDSLSPKGGVGGAQVGCNIQSGSFVYGLELDYSVTGGSNSRAYVPDPTEADSVAFSAKTQSLWSVRGRFGLAQDRTFVYATAGYAGANFNYTFALNDSGPVSIGNTSFWTNGLVIGAGVEYSLFNNIIVGAEYLHYAFGDDKPLPSVPVSGPWGAAGDHITLRTVDVIRLRASYLFNWASPVVSK